MKKGLKITIITVSSLLVVFAIFGNYLAKAVLAEVIDGLNSDKNAEVFIEYEKSRFNLFSGKVIVFGLSVHSNEQGQQFGSLEISADRISISGLHFFELIKREFDAHTIDIERPVIRLIRTGEQPDSEKRFKGKPMAVSWLKLKMRRGSVFILNGKDDADPFELHGLGFELDKRSYTTIRELLNDRLFDLKDLTFRIDKNNKTHITRSRINLDRGEARFKKVFVGNQTSHQRFFRHLESDTRWYNITIDSVMVDNLGSQSTHPDSMQSIRVYHPDFFVKRMLGLEADSSAALHFDPSQLSHGKLEVVDGKLRFRTYQNKSSKYREFRIEHVDGLTGITSERSLTDTGETKFNGSISLKEIDLDLPKKQKLEIGEVALDMDNDHLRINGLHVFHTDEPIHYLKKLQFGENWMDLYVDSIVERSIDTDRLLLKNEYISQGMKVYGFHTEIKERGDLKKRPSRKAKLMHDWFRSIPFDHRIEDICFVNSSLGYQLFFDNTATEGSLFFNGINGCIDVLANDSEYTKTKIDLRGKFNGKQYAYLKIDLPVYDKDYTYQLKGHVQNLYLKQLNTFVRPLKIRFNSGYMHRLTFSYHSKYPNCKTAGMTYFDYENLNMEALKTVKRAKKGLFGPGKKAREQDNWFLNMAINMFSKEYNMPDKDGYVVGEFEHSREPYQGFFGHMVHCMSKGAEYCLLKRKNKKKRKE